MMRVASGVAMVLAGLAVPAAGQTPQPFPRPAESRPAPPRPAEGPPVAEPSPARAPEAARQAPAAAPSVVAGSIDPDAPRPDEVVFPVYPAAKFLARYDAGRGQQYMLFGTTAAFSDIVAYYRSQLSEKGDLVFREPPTHMFEVGRFRDETMAFPPGVTVKDWTWGGSLGYPNPTLGAEPARYPTIIMIVPPPRAATGAR